MFGRRKKHAAADEDIPVDAALVGDIEQVERAVDAHLEGPSDASRRALRVALEQLDDQTDQSDEFRNSVIGSGAVGLGSRGEVVGETSVDPVVDELPQSEFNAQVALVRDAKNEIRSPSPATFSALRAAAQTLDVIRKSGTGA
jgi:hypothetical protein